MIPSRAVPALLTLLMAMAEGRAQAPDASPPPADPDDAGQARLIVRTLVIDAIGTRTVDTDTARVPWGKTGLLLKQIPRVGPPLALRLSVAVQPPQETGIPVTLSTETWDGSIDSPPPASGISRREEATILSAESSYLLELEHDPVADRRIVLSLRAAVAAEGDHEIVPLSDLSEAGALRFALSITRESAGETSPVDNPSLLAMLGRPATYGSMVRRGSAAVGLTLTLTADRIQGDLVTIRAELSGAEYVDEAQTDLRPFSHQEFHTVTFGSPFGLVVTVPAELPGPASASGAKIRPVTWRVVVTPARA